MQEYHPGLCCPFIHSVVSKVLLADSEGLAYLGVHIPHMAEDMFSHGAAAYFSHVAVHNYDNPDKQATVNSLIKMQTL